MLNQEDAEEKACRLAEEKRQLDDAYSDMIKCVLSNTQIDPKYKGKPTEFFKSFEGEVTPAQVNAFLQGKYYQGFKYFWNVWKKMPEDKRPELYRITEVVNALSKATQSMYREVEHTESQGKEMLTDLQILRTAPFLSHYNWGDKTSNFNVNDLCEALNLYLDLGIEFIHVERSVTQMCVWRAYYEQKGKAKDVSETFAEKIFGKWSYTSVFAALFFKLIGWLIPIMIYIGINIWIAIASLNHLQGKNFSYWSWAGLFYVAVTGIITLIHLGTHGTRKAIEALAKPSAPTGNTQPINVDLWALQRAANTHGQGHINLRLVREQLCRLQTTEIEFPVQLLTLIDRSIAKGVHHW